MKTKFFKKHLAFYLSAFLIYGNVPSFAVKTKQIQKCRASADMLNETFEISENQKGSFYIRKRKTGLKGGDLSIFSLIVPGVVHQNMDGDTPKCFEMDSLLPSLTKNPCATLYPFLIASLLQFAPYLLKHYNGGQRKSKSTYYLAFAHIHLHDPRVALIYPRHLSMLSNNSDKLRKSIASILSNTYMDENGAWTGNELASMTIFLHSIRNSDSFQSVASNKIYTMLGNNKNAGNRNIPNMVNPLIDIVNNITNKSYRLNIEKPISQAYKNFYLDIVKAIDPERANMFQLLDECTKEIKTDKIDNNSKFVVKLENQNDCDNFEYELSLEHKSDFREKNKKVKSKNSNKKRIRGFKRFRKIFKKLNKNHSTKEKNIMNCNGNSAQSNQSQNKLRMPVFGDLGPIFLDN